MNRADNNLRQVVRSNLNKRDGWRWTPIETGSTQQGVPDSFWAHEPTQTSGWVEHKATKGWAVNIRPHQVAWMDTHARAGVRCCFMVRASGVGSARDTGDSLWIIDGGNARELAADGLGGLPLSAILGYWTGGPVGWNWLTIERILTGRK